MSDTMKCPKCGGACERDEADVGVGTIGGPWGCPACHWIDEKFSLVDTIKQAHALQDAAPPVLDAKGWHEYLVRLAIQAYERASMESGLRSGHSLAFAKHVRERLSQAAQTLVGELPRPLKMHFDCDEGSLAVGTPPHDILWTAEGLDSAKAVRDVFVAHGIHVVFTSDCEQNCDGQRADEDE